MGTYYRWLCPKKRQYLELGNWKLHGYEWPDHAGAVVHFITTSWRAEEIVFTGDQDGPWEDVWNKADDQKWTNVWPMAWAEWKKMRQERFLDHYGASENAADSPSWRALSTNLWDEDEK